ENTLHDVYSRLKHIDFEVLVVDDSTDQTYSILKKLMKKYKNLNVVHRTNEKGVGSATRLGIKKSKGKYIITFMADSKDDAKYFPIMLEKLQKGYDVVQTSRFFKGCKIIGYKKKKKICNWLCNTFIRILFLEFKLRDFSSLFKGFDKEKINTLNLNANEFDLGLEIVLKAMKKKMKIIEIPVDWIEREQGHSKLKLSRYAKHYFKRVMGIWWNY
ncbi:unnamed protein product, partial [marine sediment metagenome]